MWKARVERQSEKERGRMDRWMERDKMEGIKEEEVSGKVEYSEGSEGGRKGTRFCGDEWESSRRRDFGGKEVGSQWPEK